MKCCLIAMIFLVVCAWTLADEPDKTDISWVKDETNCTVITSTRLSYDRTKCIAVFEENVVVNDAELNICADRMTVFYTEQDNVASIEADGDVVIAQDDKKGFAHKAVYFVKEGKIVLSGNPKVVRGSDEMSGETITLWRFKGRILCEPNAVLKLYSTDEMHP